MRRALSLRPESLSPSVAAAPWPKALMGSHKDHEGHKGAPRAAAPQSFRDAGNWPLRGFLVPFVTFVRAFAKAWRIGNALGINRGATQFSIAAGTASWNCSVHGGLDRDRAGRAPAGGE
jgi:hypothetical protein